MSYLDNIRTFVRVYELGNMSAAARDQRSSAAGASSRISQLEEHLGVRLFQRTTRKLGPTEQGRIFYDGAQRVLDAFADQRGYIFNLGSGILPKTPLDSVQALWDTVLDGGQGA